MKNKLLKLLAVICFGAILAFGVSACGGKDDGGTNSNSSTTEQSSNSGGTGDSATDGGNNNGTSNTPDGGNNSGTSNTPDGGNNNGTSNGGDNGGAGNVPVIGNSITFKTLVVDGTTVTSETSLPNATTEFSFADEIEVKGNATFQVAKDPYGSQTYLMKVVPLEEGNNTFYVFEMVGEDVMKTYTVTLRRRPMYTVEFNTEYGTRVDAQTVEEGTLATKPATDPSQLGYTFSGWDYDFTKPITESITIKANWTILPELEPFSISNERGYLDIIGINDRTVTEITIPDCVEAIAAAPGALGFRNCINLTKVTFGSRVDYIGVGAFSGCTALKEITLPSELITIDYGAFSGCTNLTNITLGDKIRRIFGCAFENCTALKEIVLPDSIDMIGSGAFV